MKKLLCAILVFVMIVPLCAPVTAVETESTFVPETFTREQLLAMDPELDSDGDGLVDVIELVYEMNRYDADTDGDGVSDYIEFCVTCTDPLNPDGHIDTDGDGLTNAQEAIHGTNPDDLDTDNDNLGDYDEIMVYHTDPLVKDNNSAASGARGKDIVQVGGGGEGAITYRYSGKLHTTYSEGGKDVDYTSSVRYNLESSWFFASNTSYNWQIANVSCLLATIAYDKNYLDNVGTSAATAVYDWFNYHGFTNYGNYDMHSDTTLSDQHLSEIFFASKTITQNGVTKNLVCVVVRGTNETLEEWQSNFDVGTTENYGTVSGWSNPKHHMGFDITANRLNDKLDEYMQAEGFNSSNTILWITGHSRGAAVANLMAAKRKDAGFNVFAYTFACPGTVEYANATEKASLETEYGNIFNIINLDDFVPQLPLTEWNFTRYGKVKSRSIETYGDYASQWDEMTGKTYAHADAKQDEVLAAFYDIIANRNDCYEYPSGSVIYANEAYLSRAIASGAAASFTAQYPAVCSGTYRYNVYGSGVAYSYYVEYQPAILMMMMAEAMKDTNPVAQSPFLLYDLPAYLDTPRDKIVSYALWGDLDQWGANMSISYPHYLESYYILAWNLS